MTKHYTPEEEQMPNTIAGLAKAVNKLRAENAHLRESIRKFGEISDTCTQYILKEICSGCRCGKAKQTLSKEEK